MWVQFLLLVQALRVMYMPHVNENKILYLDSNKLKFSNLKSDRSKMNVYIKNRSLYYMIDGDFYTFQLDNDRMTVKLVKRAKNNDVEFYTWEDSEGTENEGEPFHTLNYMKIQPGKTKRGEDPSNIPQGKFKIVEGEKHKNEESKNTKEHLKKDMKKYEKTKEHPQKPKKSISKKKPKIIKESQSSSDSFLKDSSSSHEEKHKKSKKKEDKKHISKYSVTYSTNSKLDNFLNAIESDTNESPSQVFDLKIKMTSSNDKSFNLTWDGKCLTYFNDFFILVTCDDLNTNQIFKLKNKVDFLEEDSRDGNSFLALEHNNDINNKRQVCEESKNIKIIGNPVNPILHRMDKHNTVLIKNEKNHEENKQKITEKNKPSVISKKEENQESGVIEMTLDRISDILQNKSF
ncbi:hypothetical protein EHP00_1824 [Ecytonucleospora hepatopenaei]|uniref:Uncharacterized protein n=1 Tax=Ecytonucleospora hepatopenaei TaxID=646526 RepID=A0A1W0E5B5_9MICR|nr:hypothetical protein EHP00_1824 [Ecytonucleospora hepatopenaei]